jgi:hypothetical protein
MSYITDSHEEIPIYASEAVHNHRNQLVQFREFLLSSSKFGNDENALLRIYVEEYKGTR